MQYLPQDLRLASRRLRQQPGFATVVVLTLAIGLGANIAIFTLVHALILRSLPVERPHELYRLGQGLDCCVNSGLPDSFSLFSFRLFEHLQANAPEFSELAAFQANTTAVGVRRAGQSESSTLPGAFVTGNYFTMFGVRPASGRLFTADDDRPGAVPVAVLSYQAWRRYFGQDPSVVGGDFVLNGQPFTIIGVSAEPFFGDTIRPDPAAIWLPIAQEPYVRGAASILDRSNQHWLYAIGRLRPDAEPSEVSGRVTTALQQWLVEQPFVSSQQRAEIGRHSITVAPASGGIAHARAQYGRSLNTLLGASAMVLLIALANLANLLLARADRGQVAIRMALGASRRRLIQQSVVEGVVLGLAGGAIGVVVAAYGTRTLLGWVFPAVEFLPIGDSPSAAVWLFAATLAVVAGVAFSAGPAWMMAHAQPLDELSSVGRSVTTRSFVPRGWLLVVQVALSLALLTSAGLLASSLGRLENQPLGFDPENRIVVHVSPPAIAGDVDRISGLVLRIEETVRRVPGVEQVAYSMYSPMDGNNWSSRISIAGRRADPDQPDISSWNRVSPAFFDTLGIRVRRGRDFDERDTPASPRVAVVNEAFARRFFDGGDPVGQSVGIGDATHAQDFEIVGVVADVKFAGARELEARPMLFLPMLQSVTYTDATERNVQARSMLPQTIIVRTAPGARDVEGGVRRALAEADQNLSVRLVLPMPLQVSGNFRVERLLSRLVTLYGALALAVAMLGLYGITAYAVSQRRRELGVRMALGATRWRVIHACIRGPLWQTGLGIALGVAASIAAARAIASQLYGAEGLDAGALGAALVALMVCALVAAALPAAGAAAANPSEVLRGD